MHGAKAIIFDWGRTLHDPEKDRLFSGVPEILEALSKKYELALVSLAVSEDSATRRKKIDESGIAQYFKLIFVDVDNKEKMYDEVLAQFGCTAGAVALVDDRVVRGIAWGNQHGATTVWIRQGQFANELPNTETGEPKFTITDIRELAKIFL